MCTCKHVLFGGELIAKRFNDEGKHGFVSGLSGSLDAVYRSLCTGIRWRRGRGRGRGRWRIRYGLCETVRQIFHMTLRFRLHCWPNLVSYSNINTFSAVMIQKGQLDNRLLMNSYWTHRDSTPFILCCEFPFHVFFNAFSHLIRACSISSQTNNFNQRSVHFFRVWKQQLIYCA